MRTEKQFRNKVSFVSFLLSVLVISIHTFNLEIYGIVETEFWSLQKVVYVIETFCRSVQNICVPFFFILSGFLFFRNFEWSMLWNKYRSRMKSVIMPYFVWCSLYYIYFVILTHLNLVGSNVIPLDAGTWFSWLWRTEYYTLWFLKELIVMIVLSPIIYVILRDKKCFRVGFFVLVALWCLEIFHVKVPLQPFNIYYMLGAYLGINWKNAPLMCNRKLTKISILVAPGWLMLITLKTGHIISISGTEPVFILIGCLTLWFVLDIFHFEIKIPWWMNISFFIYCFHDMILEAFEKVFLIVFGMHAWCALVDYFVMPVIVLTVIIGVAAFLKRYMPKVWWVLAGART